jgi:hypothetical protein
MISGDEYKILCNFLHSKSLQNVSSKERMRKKATHNNTPMKAFCGERI